MTITTTEQVDLLWKKVIYGVTDTSLSPTKNGYNETIASPIPVYDSNVWTQASTIPVTAPGSTTGVVTFYGTSSAIHMTADPTVAGNIAWLATSTFGTVSSRLTNWIPPSVDPTYLVTVYNGDPNSGGTSINQGVNGQEWVFDYSAGVLFFPNAIPSGLTQVWLVGYRYTGTIGLSATLNTGEVSIAYAGVTQSSTYTFTGFFANTPITNSSKIYFNGLSIHEGSGADYTVSGLNLVLNLTNIGYSLEAGDVISGTYNY
jgi:hypothetical protein